MADQQWEELTDKVLVREAFSGHGERFAELMRRLKNSNERLAWVNIVLTVALVVLAVIQLLHR